ncbi:MAG TPA: hypothetical protein VFS49_11590 [Croceibacterium sp.]|nr:hypothetical protein [Croceibacterium sp.]
MSATALKDRLRADLKSAMQARSAAEIRLLRTLIAAIDNAEAVTGEAVPDKYVARAFGDPSGEVPRRVLDDEALGRLLANEVDARLAAADDFERLGQAAEADRLREEASLVARYRSG